MLAILSTFLLSVSLAGAAPLPHRRAVSTLPVGRLDAVAVAEAMQRDDTATRAVTGQSIKTTDGQCLQVTSGTGDFRENLLPVEIKACDDSAGQKWDVITAGRNNNGNAAGQALVVSALTQGCLNFDPRRKAGNQALLFSCGGRADGEGLTTGSQLFPFVDASQPIQLTPFDAKTTCLFPSGGLLDAKACTGAETFTFGDTAAAPAPAPEEPATPAPAPAPPAAALTDTKLDAAATAEAMQRDDTAVRAVSGKSIKAADGTCLTVTSGTGDFRENLIPVEMKTCDGSAGQLFDVITEGKHNNGNIEGGALIVSTLTQGCLNFDPRRAAGNQALLFSCGGRADGEGLTTDSQLFPFVAANSSIELAPANAQTTCLTNQNGRLNPEACTGSQTFTFV